MSDSSTAEFGKGMIESSWLPAANTEAQKLGDASGQQEGLKGRLDAVNKRLEKVSPDGGVLEKGMKFLGRVAEKQARRMEKWAEGHVKKADALTSSAEKNLNKVDELQAKVGKRITAEKQTQNIKTYIEQQGLTVNLKDKNTWFDRVVVAGIDNMRTAWNEASANRSSKRAEGRLHKAGVYKSVAIGLLSGATAMRGALERGLNDQDDKRTSELNRQKADLANQQADNANAIADAADALNAARNEIPVMATAAASQVDASGSNIGEVAQNFSADAAKTLDNKANNNVI